MNENHQDKAKSKPITTEDKLWYPPLSSKDQQKLDRLRSKGKKFTSSWTGFADRTLWDWIQFFAVLAIPIIVAAGTLYFTQQITFQQAQLSIAVSEKQHQTDIQIATDQQQEATLKIYLDDMSDLLLTHHLREAKPGDEVSEVARERLLAVLRRLDAGRNGIALQFLQDAHLVAGKKAVIDLSNTDLSGDDSRNVNLSNVNLLDTNLSGTNLSGATLSSTNLNGADLSDTNLSGADLQGVDLRNANLDGTNLSKALLGCSSMGINPFYLLRPCTSSDEAKLKGADLSGDLLCGVNLDYAVLSGANLSRATLSCIYYKTSTSGISTSLNFADLSGANLSGAEVTEEQLAEVWSLKGAIMPNKSVHP